MTAVSAQAARPSAFSVFRNRNFRLLWTGQLVSTMGSALTSLAAGILIFRQTGSALSVGLMMMATALPTLLVGLVAGVFVDRYDRKRIMIIADVLRALLVVLIPFLVPLNIAWLYIIVMLSAGVGQFFDPAHESVLPEVATDEELAAANSMMAISSFGSTAIGFAVSGLIASRFPIEWAFYIDALTFLFSAACIVLIRIQPLVVEGKTTVKTVLHNMTVGARFLKNTPILRSLLSVRTPVLFIFGLQNVLLLPFALTVLHATEFEYGLQEGLTSLAFAVGSLFMASRADRLREGQWLTISYLGMAVASLFYALSTRVPMAILFVMLSGFMNAPSFIAGRLIFQRNTPREMRGRVASAMYVSRDVVYMLGMAAAGLADVFGAQMIFFVSALGLFVVGLISLVMPGLGQPAAEWKRAVSLLRGAKAAPGLGIGRAATLADFDRLAMHVTALGSLSAKERQELAAQSLLAEAPAATVILRKGETSDAAYFIIEGRAVAGWDEEGGYRPLETLNAGDFFGEIAALTGAVRTANVVAEEPTTVLQVPAPALRQMTKHAELNRLFLSRMTERMARMNMLDLPRFGGMDQQTLRELRTPDPQPVVATGPAVALES